MHRNDDFYGNFCCVCFFLKFVRTFNLLVMKRKILLGSMLFVVTFSVFTISYSLKTVTLSELLLANIEALTSNEDLSGGESEFISPSGYPYTIVCNVAISDKRRCKATVITCQGGGVGCNPRPCPVHR